MSTVDQTVYTTTQPFMDQLIMAPDMSQVDTLYFFMLDGLELSSNLFDQSY